VNCVFGFPINAFESDILPSHSHYCRIRDDAPTRLEIKRWDYGVCEKIRKLRQVEIDRDFGD